ncbi:MAG TPA: hypothetical protein VI685_22590, partial [Candidatus Angelobacter sp.]
GNLAAEGDPSLRSHPAFLHRDASSDDRAPVDHRRALQWIDPQIRHRGQSRSRGRPVALAEREVSGDPCHVGGGTNVAAPRSAASPTRWGDDS